jgi:hypothetical protein
MVHNIKHTKSVNKRSAANEAVIEEFTYDSIKLPIVKVDTTSVSATIKKLHLRRIKIPMLSS